MTSRDLIRHTIEEGDGPFGTFHIFYPFVGEPGFEKWGLLVARDLNIENDVVPDMRRVNHALRSSTALSTGTLRICYEGIDYDLFGQPHAASPTRGDRPAIAISRKIEGASLHDMFTRNGSRTWEILDRIDQQEYTDLMLQLRLAREEGHCADLEHRGNIMLRKPSTGRPTFNLIDLTYDNGWSAYTDNRPEYLMRLFFPVMDNDDEPKAKQARANVFAKLLEGAKQAGMGTSNSINDIEKIFNQSDLNGDPSSLSKNQRTLAACMLWELPLPEGNIDRTHKPRLPKELRELGPLSLKESAEALRAWLDAIHSSKAGRGIGDYK